MSAPGSSYVAGASSRLAANHLRLFSSGQATFTLGELATVTEKLSGFGLRPVAQSGEWNSEIDPSETYILTAQAGRDPPYQMASEHVVFYTTLSTAAGDFVATVVVKFRYSTVENQPGRFTVQNMSQTHSRSVISNYRRCASFLRAHADLHPNIKVVPVCDMRTAPGLLDEGQEVNFWIELDVDYGRFRFRRFMKNYLRPILHLSWITSADYQPLQFLQENMYLNDYEDPGAWTQNIRSTIADLQGGFDEQSGTVMLCDIEFTNTLSHFSPRMNADALLHEYELHRQRFAKQFDAYRRQRRGVWRLLWIILWGRGRRSSLIVLVLRFLLSEPMLWAYLVSFGIWGGLRLLSLANAFIDQISSRLLSG